METKTKGTLFFFADTNLFIQCYSLEELDWAEWQEYEEIRIMVCRPVQREIDIQKGQGNNRVANRARSAYKIFRHIIYSEEGLKLIQNRGPRVTLHLEGPSLPSKELKDVLDYSRPDDEIIGCLHRFRKENPSSEARLLTHDSGPMMTAKSLGIPFTEIKESWILAPEHSKEEREIVRLKSENELLRKSEPIIEVRCLCDNGNDLVTLEADYPLYEPLTKQEVEGLIDQLKRKHPVVTDFDNDQIKDGPTRLSLGDMSNISILGNPSFEAIANYQEREYPEWLSKCRDALVRLHKTLQWEVEWPCVRFTMKNEGNRPGNNVLVEFIAKGDFKLFPAKADAPDLHIEEENTDLRLPLPPEPPRRRSIMEGIAGLAESINYPIFTPSSLIDPSDFVDDPNAFYYKPEFPKEPAKSISLICDKWRHGPHDEEFIIEICTHSDQQRVNGQLDCVIQAENLSSAVRKSVDVRINIIKMKTVDIASNLVKILNKS